MPACPAGHDSSAADFCDICGVRISGATPSAVAASSALPAAPDAGGATADPCPQCGTDQTGKFCEVCGFDFAAGIAGPMARPAASQLPREPSQAASAGREPATVGNRPVASVVSPAASPTVSSGSSAAWTATVTADRDYFDAVVAAGGPDAALIQFPDYCPERRFSLAGAQMRIGRRSVSRGVDPEIDLTGPPTDPGISHLHAVLIAQPDGRWSVLDPGSSNGTQVNGTDVTEGVPTQLNDGDRVCLGAWTMLTIHAG